MNYLGVDFSGSAAMWGPGVTRSNVWVAEAAPTRRGLRVVRLRRVQELPRNEGERPFAALARLIAEGEHAGAGIDAPCSLPERYFPPGVKSHDALLCGVQRLAASQPDDFPRGQAFRDWALGDREPVEAKPLRETERLWRSRGPNVRSTLWAGPRGGAAFTSACLTLLGVCRGRVWPWSKGPAPVMEAFPAAQLWRWGMTHNRYDGEAGRPNRTRIVDLLLETGRVAGGGREIAAMRDSADTLDAVLCAFAPLAVARDRLAEPLPAKNVWRREGWIAVHA